MLTAAEIQVLLLSLRVGVVCVALSLLPAIALGWVLARLDFRGKLLVDGICHLPLVLPPVVTGYLLLLLFGSGGVLGEPLERVFGLQLAFNWKGAALASAVVGFPLLLRSIRTGLESVDPRLEEVARTLGAGPARAFCTITLRLAAPSVLAGCLLSFGRSLGEFGATITFAANIPGETRTIPAAVYTYLQQPGGEAQAGRLVIISIALSLLALLGSECLARRLRRR